MGSVLPHKGNYLGERCGPKWKVTKETAGKNPDSGTSSNSSPPGTQRRRRRKGRQPAKPCKPCPACLGCLGTGEPRPPVQPCLRAAPRGVQWPQGLSVPEPREQQPSASPIASFQCTVVTQAGRPSRASSGCSVQKGGGGWRKVVALAIGDSGSHSFPKSILRL